MTAPSPPEMPQQVEDALLDVYLDGMCSGMATVVVCHLVGELEDSQGRVTGEAMAAAQAEASRFARAQTAMVADDPSLRESARDQIRARLAGVQPPDVLIDAPPQAAE